MCMHVHDAVSELLIYFKGNRHANSRTTQINFVCPCMTHYVCQYHRSSQLVNGMHFIASTNADLPGAATKIGCHVALLSIPIDLFPLSYLLSFLKPSSVKKLGSYLSEIVCREL